jgi:hypothetical protein
VKKPPSLPLTTPDGEVLAYACGLCRSVRIGAESMGPPDAEERAELAEYRRSDADRCCTCRECGVVAIGISMECDACEVKRRERLEAEQPARDARAAEEESIREAALAKALDRDAAVLLALRMSDLSEECWCAGWLTDCEFELWTLIHEGPSQWGMGEVTAADIAELRRLSAKSGGWVTYREGVGTVFVPMDEWLAMAASKAA